VGAALPLPKPQGMRYDVAATSARFKSCSATGREHHADLHPRPQPRPSRSHESRRPRPPPVINRTQPGWGKRDYPVNIPDLANSGGEEPGLPAKCMPHRTRSTPVPPSSNVIPCRGAASTALRSSGELEVMPRKGRGSKSVASGRNDSAGPIASGGVKSMLADLS
jgi:hypothetical protein